ncbi:MAG: hypothetical protein P8I94_01165, partial [Emcibacteraceae bacterium]|nr:hypothetical protein [Emcibacteraceae bacterium]
MSKYIRTSAVIVQRLYIPVALLAGLFGLFLGNNGLSLFSFSDAADSYGAVLIAVIFASVGLSTEFPKLSQLINRTGKLFVYNQTVTISQWILALITGLFILVIFFPDISPSFGIIMPAGFMGGHGTASAVGNSLIELGWDDALTLALTSATFGIFSAVLGGLLLINIGARLGLIKNVTRFKDMELHFRKGLIPKAERVSIGEETVSASSVNVFTLHVSLISVVTAFAFYLANYLSSFNQYISIPVFACAFLLGCLCRTVMKRFGALPHFENRLFLFGAGTATDYLVVFGIASIKITVLITYAVPFLILMVLGLTLCVFLLFFVAPKMLGKQWFEKGIFSWGWMTGTVAMGILLLRIADPNGKNGILEDYAIAYIPGSVVDIILISFVPTLIMTGFGLN